MSDTVTKITNPSISTWLPAHAGSGKTYALTARFMRLLLAGTRPENITCITYTKVAAVNLSERISDRLSDWSQMPDMELANDLEELNGEVPSREKLQLARRLFLEVLECNNGLNITTIHSFCANILRQFPLEVNIEPNFREIDQTEASQLIAASQKHVIHQASLSESEISRGIQICLNYGKDSNFNKALEAIIANRQKYETALAKTSGQLQVDMDLYDGALVEISDLGREFWREHRDMFLRLHDIRENNSSAMGKTLISALARIDDSPELQTQHLDVKNEKAAKADAFDKISTTFLNKAGAVKANLITKSLKRFDPGLCEEFQTFLNEGANLVQKRSNLREMQASTALLSVAHKVVENYVERKANDNLLDFDDLILKAHELLSGENAMQVQYSIDNRVDHLLIDEAQDTSPLQWNIIKSIVSEFFSGASASERDRSLFVVGDEKQSIMSFQGADVENFKRYRDEFGAGFRTAQLAWQDNLSLDKSYRSSPIILDFVDKLFEPEASRIGLSDTVIRHRAHHEFGGEIEIWPPFLSDGQLSQHNDKSTRESYLVDADATDNSVAVEARTLLCERIAQRIEELIDTHEHALDEILILARARTNIFQAMSKALTKLNIPHSRNDREKLVDNLLVRDLLALGRLTYAPNDDLSAAALLRSPLFAISEQELHTLAADRGNETILERLAATPSLRDTHECLMRWINVGKSSRPYDFYSYVLIEQGGRARFIDRLGHQAAEVCDSLLEIFLSDAERHSSLMDIVEKLISGNFDKTIVYSELKNTVRLMTVHGAKGLEADSVFVIDTGNRTRNDGQLYSGGSGDIIWNSGSTFDTEIIKQHKERIAQDNLKEHQRLLYVALTRARKRLILCQALDSTQVKRVIKEYGANLDTAEIAKGAMQNSISTKATEKAAAAGIDAGIPATWSETVLRSGVLSAGVRGVASVWKQPARSAPAHWSISSMEPPAAPIVAKESNSQRDLATEQASAEWSTTSSATPSTMPAWYDLLIEKSSPPPQDSVPWLAPTAPMNDQEPEMTTRRDRKFSVISEPSREQHASPHLTREQALLRGDVTHKLFQYLPQLETETSQEVISKYLETKASSLPEVVRADIARDCLTWRGSDFAQSLFAAQNYSEVEITTGLRPDSDTQISGRIDLLCVSKDSCKIIDYKSDRQLLTSGELPEAYIEQIARYWLLVWKAFATSDQNITAYIIGTAKMQIVPVTPTQIHSAIARLYPDELSSQLSERLFST